jgi:hypothetical protein
MLAASAAQAADPTGIWIDDKGRGGVEIKDCGGKLCGHVVWTKDTNDSKGCGKQIIGDASPVSDGVWDNGWIYSPEKKRKYDVELKPLADGTLRVKGYAGTKLFSKTMIWTKAPADIVRCSGPIDANAVPAPADKAAAAAPAAKTNGNETTTAKPGTETPSNGDPSRDVAKAEPADGTGSPPPDEADAKTGTDPKADEPEVAIADQPAAEADEPKGAKENGNDIDFGNGYGIKETSNGKCRLKVPFVTITMKCPD